MAERDSGQPLGSALDAPDITPLLEDFKTNIDKLETGLKPLLEQDLSETLSKLPVLDKAKLYCLLTYAIESMLSCAYLIIVCIYTSQQNVYRFRVANSTLKHTLASMALMSRNIKFKLSSNG